jgi:hypothetical protein
MRVLVAAAGRHGATAEIAETIGGALSGQRTQVDVVGIDDVRGLGDYDAVVLGSAVYMGLAQAGRGVRRHRQRRASGASDLGVLERASRRSAAARGVRRGRRQGDRRPRRTPGGAA